MQIQFEKKLNVVVRESDSDDNRVVNKRSSLMTVIIKYSLVYSHVTILVTSLRNIISAIGSLSEAASAAA